jgi:hypothetical protein
VILHGKDVAGGGGVKAAEGSRAVPAPSGGGCC